MIFGETTRAVTEKLRLELKEKTQELALPQQERTVFQNSLDTAQMEVDLLERMRSRVLRNSLNGPRGTELPRRHVRREEVGAGRMRIRIGIEQGARRAGQGRAGRVGTDGGHIGQEER